MPAWTTLSNFAGLVFLGLLAGFEVAVHYGLGSPPAILSREAQIQLRQAHTRRLRVLSPALFLPAFIFAVWCTVRSVHQQNLWARALGLAGLLLWIVIRVARTIPVNSATMDWDPAHPPTDWRQEVERAERFHVLAAWAAVVAFLCFLAVSLPAAQR